MLLHMMRCAKQPCQLPAVPDLLLMSSDRFMKINKGMRPSFYRVDMDFQRAHVEICTSVLSGPASACSSC